MGYDRWRAGEIVTATKLNSMIPQYILQVADLSKTNSTLANTDITFTPDVSATYYYEMYISYGATNLCNFKWSWSAAQATFKRFVCHLSPVPAPDRVDTGAEIVMRYPAQGEAVQTSGLDTIPEDGNPADGNAGFLSAWDRGTFTTTATPASITLQVAQGTTNATAAIFRGANNSRLVYQRIA